MSGLNNSERQLLHQLVTRLNLIERNAKKIDELPLKSTLNGNDLLHISENGASKKLAMSKFLDIIQNRSFDHLVSVTNMQLIGNQFSVESASWEISSILNILSTPFLQNIPYSASGLLRKDIVVGNTNNELVYIQGEENEGISFAPPIPPSTVLITEFDVTDNSVNNSQPIIGDNFKDKSESSIIDIYNVGSLPNLSVNSNAAHFRFHNATDLKSLFISDASKVYPGKLFYITNKKNTTFLIHHNANGVNVHQPFVFPTNTNYSVQPNETLTFFWSENKLNYLSSNMVKNGGAKVLLLDTNPNGTVATQGVTGTIILKSYTVGELKTNAVYRVTCRMKKIGTEQYFTTSVTLNDNSNFPINSVNSIQAANLTMSFIKHLSTHFDGTNFKMISFGTSGGFYSDTSAQAVSTTGINITPSANNIFRLKVTTPSVNDKISLDYLLIEEITM